MSLLFDPSVIREIVKVIEEHHTAVAAALYGESSVTPEAWKMAIGLDLVDPTNPAVRVSEQLHHFGAFMAHLDHASQYTRYGTTIDDFMAEIKRNPVPRTEVEVLASEAANQRAAQYIVGLGNKVGAKIGSRLIEADKELDHRLRSAIKDVVSARFGDEQAAKRMRERGIKAGKEETFFDDSFRSTTKRVASDIGHATNDWGRDLKRIAQTETQRALNDGLKASWDEQEKEKAKADKRPLDKIIAFKLPRPDACKHCLRLHSDNAGNPKLYYLDDMESNGNNIGRRAAEWKATIDPVHPFCACQLVRLPKFIELPKEWRSGLSAPAVVGEGGNLIDDAGE